MTEQASAVRTWAQRCADSSRDLVPVETQIWDAIAERGCEWQLARTPDGLPDHGGALLTPRLCFANAARTVHGMTRLNAAGCHYAEGFALSNLGFWFHHAWIISAAGLVIERTWPVPADRYVGVITSVPVARIGECQLTCWPAGIAFAPALVAVAEKHASTEAGS